MSDSLGCAHNVIGNKHFNHLPLIQTVYYDCCLEQFAVYAVPGWYTVQHGEGTLLKKATSIITVYVWSEHTHTLSSVT